MLRPYKVRQYGTDSSGRPVYMNQRMKAAFDAACDRIGFVPTIVQGAYMKRVPGGGADDSAGYHDAGGCIDTRTWDLTDLQQTKVIHGSRSVGWGTWKRDEAHGGMDEHMHWNLLGDKQAASGAKQQMADYRNGGDGMGGSDYHWRPNPIPTFSYPKWWKNHRKDRSPMKEIMAWYKTKKAFRADIKQLVKEGVNDTKFKGEFDALRKSLTKRQEALMQAVKALADAERDDATKEQLSNARASLEKALNDLAVLITQNP